MSRVLIDGWSIVHAPSSHEALQVWALLAWCPAQIEVLLALPGEQPDWLSGNFQCVHKKVDDTAWGRLNWEQRYLPALGAAFQASSLHIVSSTAPLVGNFVRTCSPAWYANPRGGGLPLAARLRLAAGAAGSILTQKTLWPSDLPGKDSHTHVNCPPFVHPAFLSRSPQVQNLELPDTFVLYHGPSNESSLRFLLACWSWAAGPIGEYYPLLLLGLNAPSQNLAGKLLKEYGLSDNVHCIPDLPTNSLPGLYQRCSALLHPAEITPWGDAMLHAMACGLPIAAAALPDANSRVGSAAYLAAPIDPRALGAAIITIIVEQEMAESFSKAAQARFSSHNTAIIQEALAQIWKI